MKVTFQIHTYLKLMLLFYCSSIQYPNKYFWLYVFLSAFPCKLGSHFTLQGIFQQSKSGGGTLVSILVKVAGKAKIGRVMKFAKIGLKLLLDNVLDV